MSTELETIATLFKSLHNELTSIIHDLSDEELDWVPIEGPTNSIGVLVTHLIGAESFRIHQMAGGIDINRDRDSEFLGNPRNNSELISEISRVGTRTAEVLGCLSPTDLAIVRPSVRSYEDAETIRWHILHAIEHFGRHLGHIELTRQLYAELSRG